MNDATRSAPDSAAPFVPPDAGGAAIDEFWDALGDAIRRHRDSVDAGPIAPTASAAAIGAHLDRTYTFEHPVPPAQLVGEIATMFREWNLHTTHRRYFGLFNPDALPVTIAADALVAAFNPQLAAWSHSPGSQALEAHTLAVFQRLLGHDPATASASFTTGGLEANHSGLIVALADRVPGFVERGLAAAGARPTVYLSQESHHSFVKAAIACGLGSGAVRTLAVGDDLRLDPAALRDRIRRDRADGFLPFFVVGTAGTTSSGIVDPLAAIAGIAREEGLWFHVDAAWGGGALMSRRLRGVLDGIERADSVTWDAHKWLSVPMGAGMFFSPHRAAVQHAFGTRTPYMPAPGQAPDPWLNTLQWTRRNIGLKAFAALASLGTAGYERLIDHQAAMGDRLRGMLRADGWQIVNDTPLPVVCFTHPRIEAGEITAAAAVAATMSARDVWISEVVLQERRRALRACITNYRTTGDDLRILMRRLNDAVTAVA